MSGDRAAPDYLPHVRAERLIASGRACLALFALVGVLVDPIDEDTFGDDTLRFLAVYSAGAVIYYIGLLRGWMPTRRAALISHGLDLSIAVILTLLTRGSGSPYFMFFTFLLLSGAVRWAGPGALYTGLTVMTAYAIVGLLSLVGELTLELELNRFAVRFGLLVVMTIILVQVGTYQRGLYDELRQLVRWPRNGRESLDDILKEQLGHAAAMLDVREVLLAWRPATGDAVQFARWRDGEVERFSDAADARWPLAIDSAQAESFVFDGTRRHPRIISGADAPRELSSGLLDEGQLAAQGIRTLIGAPLPGLSHVGWVLLVNRVTRPLSGDDLLLAEIVAGELGRSFERWHVAVRTREAALAEERLRVARDLHDGVLQSLTGCRLGIAGVASSASTTLPAVAEELAGLERAIAHEQQELRRFIQRLGPSPAADAPRDTAPLRHLCERVQRQWKLAIQVHPSSDESIPAPMAPQLLLLCHEALVNAARHARPSSARVTVERAGDEILLVVADDGGGFPFHGRYDAAQLAAMGVGPRTLRERAEAMGGTLSVVSTPRGSTVEIRLPRQEEPVCA